MSTKKLWGQEHDLLLFYKLGSFTLNQFCTCGWSVMFSLWTVNYRTWKPASYMYMITVNIVTTGSLEATPWMSRVHSLLSVNLVSPGSLYVVHRLSVNQQPAKCKPSYINKFTGVQWCTTLSRQLLKLMFAYWPASFLFANDRVNVFSH